MLICIEGLTNSGKTTLCKNLISELPLCYINGLMFNDVVSGNISKITHPIENKNAFDVETELLLYSTILSQKAHHIKKNISKDQVLLVDRFTLSIYAQFSIYPLFDSGFIKDLLAFSSSNIVPDLTIFLDIDLNSILARSSDSPFSRKDISLPKNYEQIRKAYLSNINSFSKDYVVIDCHNETAGNILRKVKEIIEGYTH